MGLGGTNADGKPSLEPARPKPVIAPAAGGMLGAYVARARQDSVQQATEELHASGRGLNLNIKPKTKTVPRKSSRGNKHSSNTSGSKSKKTNGGSGLTEVERQQLAMQREIAEEKARRYEAIERGEIAAHDECNVDFSARAPTEPAQRRSETPPPSRSSDAHQPGRGPQWESQGFQRQRSRSPSPYRGHSARFPTHSNQRGSPVYNSPGHQPGERASPTYEPYRARSQEGNSPTYDQSNASRTRRAGLGYGGGTEDGYPQNFNPRSEATERMMQRHHEEFVKRQEKWQLADDEKQRQRALLREALPEEQARIKRVMEQGEKRRLEEDAMQERLVDMMIARARFQAA